MKNIIDITLFMERNRNKNKDNLLDFVRERICKYSKGNTSPDKIAGMCMLMDDIKKLSERYFLEDEKN